MLMDFSEALDACKAGEKIYRSGWNGPDQFVVYQKGYPEGIPINQNTAEATGLEQGTVCQFAPYLMIFNAQGVFVPWVATIGDLLAEDWEASL
jgi:Protein of unknown function (DUF2829)